MGIDTIAQFLAFGLFLLGFAGIALIVVNATRGQAARGGFLMAAIGIVGGVIFLIVSEGIVTVGATERGVVFNMISGDLAEDPLDPGIHVVIPVMQQVTLYNVSRLEYTMSSMLGEGQRSGQDDAVQARSIDGQEVTVDVTLIYSIVPEDAEIVHRNWSAATNGYENALIRPQLRSTVRDVIATAEAQQIFGGERVGLQAEMKTRMETALRPEGFQVVDLLLREISFSDEFINAIEERQVEELRRDRANIEAERVLNEARGRANAAIEAARGSAESQRINAQAEADVIRIRAAAEAEALRVVSEQIAANPNLIQYLYVQNLSDNINIAMIPSNSPFLFDASTFTQLGEGFVAPAVPEIDTSSDGGN